MIDNIYINDADEAYAPPERPVLRVTLIGDVAFLAIGKHTETADTQTFTSEQTIGVPVSDLTNALKIENISNARRAYIREMGDTNLIPVNL